MIRLAALGGLAVLYGDAPVAGSAGRGRSLALLALIDGGGECGTHRDRLAALLWPDSDESRARHSLDQALYTLRRALGADVFIDVSGGLAFNRQRIDSDVAAFRRALDARDADGAVRLYGGPYLDGFHLSRAAEFERWVDTQRSELEELYGRALATLARRAADTGDHQLAADHLGRLAAVRPFSSGVALERMRALERAGDRPKALEVAAVHDALVRDELGTPPDSAVLAYVRELRSVPDPIEQDSTVPVQSNGSPPAEITAASDATERAAVPAPSAPAATPASVIAAAARNSERKATRAPHAAAVLTVVSVLVTLGVMVAVGMFASPGVNAGDVRDSGSTAYAGPALVRVAVFENETGDTAFAPLGRMAADWIAEGLVRTGLVRVMGPETHSANDGARGARAHGEALPSVTGLVHGRLYRLGDSIVVRAAIRHPSTGELIRALDPIATHIAAPERALEPLRQGVLGAMGTLHDVRISTFVQSTLRPPAFESYRAFASGLDRYSARDLPGMAAQFRRAVDIDPDYLTARLWLAWAASMMNDFATADSVVAALRADRERMSPVERAWHDRQTALLAGDNQRSYEAAARMAELAPRSAWVIALADAALTINRPSEVITVLENAGLDGFGPTRDHAASLLTAAYHAVGDFERELEVTDETVQAIGLDWDFNGPGVRALAALGRIDELHARLGELRGMPPTMYDGPRGPASLLAAAVELRAHGRADVAAELIDTFLAAERPLHRAGRAHGVDPSASSDEDAGLEPDARWMRVRLLYELGRWDAAERVLGPVAADADYTHRSMSALIAARRGDEEAARVLDAELAAVDEPWLFGEPTVWRARLAAVLGDDERALRLLHQAFAEGQFSRLRWQLHTSRDFDGLRGDSAFRSLVEGS